MSSIASTFRRFQTSSKVRIATTLVLNERHGSPFLRRCDLHAVSRSNLGYAIHVLGSALAERRNLNEEPLEPAWHECEKRPRRHRTNIPRGVTDPPRGADRLSGTELHAPSRQHDFEITIDDRDRERLPRVGVWRAAHSRLI